MLSVFLMFIFCSFSVQAITFPDLPEGVSNNAVAQVNTSQGDYLISFMGLGQNKDHKAVHNKVWALKIGDQHWQQKSPVPSSLTLKGRLASIAATVNEHVYLFGGYTVAEDHQEISSPDVFRYDVSQDTYQKLTPMPVPVDDSVALVYQNRYIYLVSGWHNAGNVNLVQIYDTATDSWQQGSPFLGQPVFGHSGAITGNNMIICDGVIVVPQRLKRRKYDDIAQCYIGKINAQQVDKVDWQLIDHPTGVAKYRMAAAALKGSVFFVGGSDNPYNYNGIGYNTVPSNPSNEVWQYNIAEHRWLKLSQKQDRKLYPATMDHRGLIIYKNQLLTIGGMEQGQRVSNKVSSRQLL